MHLAVIIVLSLLGAAGLVVLVWYLINLATTKCPQGFIHKGFSARCVSKCELSGEECELCYGQGKIKDPLNPLLCECNEGYAGNLCNICATGYQRNRNGACVKV